MRTHGSIRSALIAAAAAATLTLTPASASAESPVSEYGIGTACVLVNLIYGPTKFLYATGGALVSGFAWIFSAGDNDVARPIWDAAMRGDYVVVPAQLRGEKRLDFIGRSPARGDAAGTPWREESPHEGF